MGDNETNKLLLSTLQILTEIKSIIFLSSYNQVKDALLFFLASEEKIKVYDCMDGISTVNDISAKTGVNARFISEWGQEWEKVGLVIPSVSSSVQGRRQKIFDLDIYGIS